MTTHDTLQDKIRKLLLNNSRAFATRPKDYDIILDEKGVTEVIPQIIKCIEDEGYVQLAYNPAKQEVAGKPIAEILVTSDVMTGRDWYSRFESELKGKTFPHGDTNKYVVKAVNECLEAAKRASGISDE